MKLSPAKGYHLIICSHLSLRQDQEVRHSMFMPRRTSTKNFDQWTVRKQTLTLSSDSTAWASVNRLVFSDPPPSEKQTPIDGKSVWGVLLATWSCQGIASLWGGMGMYAMCWLSTKRHCVEPRVEKAVGKTLAKGVENKHNRQNLRSTKESPVT